MERKIKYNPQIHHRRSIRLKGYDYSQAGAYFITICCQKMECRFGRIIDVATLAGPHEVNAGSQDTEALLELNQYGTVAYNEWLKLPERFTNVELDVFQIMPNHMHGIIILTEPVGPPLAGALDVDAEHDGAGDKYRAGVNPAPTAVGNIIGAYKSLVANGCLEIYKSNNEGMGKLWQRNFHEHIIRNEKSYSKIANYIINNTGHG